MDVGLSRIHIYKCCNINAAEDTYAYIQIRAMDE
jgi:hypothetical protein